jgi:hypothetical protein
MKVRVKKIAISLKNINRGMKTAVINWIHP